MATKNADGQAAPERATAPPTYIVLKLIAPRTKGEDSTVPEGAERWEIVATDVSAPKAADAVRKHAEANKHATDLAGSYVAVASARWNPVPVGAKTDIVLTFGANGDAG